MKDGQCNVSKHWLPSVVIDMNVVIVDIDSVLASEVKDRWGVGGVMWVIKFDNHHIYSCDVW